MWIDLLPIALLGGLLGLDVVSFPQAMISRPLVAATIAGWLIGDSATGLLVGAALELIALDTLPLSGVGIGGRCRGSNIRDASEPSRRRHGDGHDRLAGDGLAW